MRGGKGAGEGKEKNTPPPFPRACAPRGKIRMACETRCVHGYCHTTEGEKSANVRSANAAFLEPFFLACSETGLHSFIISFEYTCIHVSTCIYMYKYELP